MNKIFGQIQQARYELVNRARSVSTYFKNGGGVSTTVQQDDIKFAWTSEEQKQRAKEFHELANKLANANKNSRAA